MTDTALLVAAIITSNMAVLAVVVALHVRLAAEVAEVRGDLGALRRDVASQGERLARIEGAVLGPWRPAEPEGEGK